MASKCGPNLEGLCPLPLPILTGVSIQEGGLYIQKGVRILSVIEARQRFRSERVSWSTHKAAPFLSLLVHTYIHRSM